MRTQLWIQHSPLAGYASNIIRFSTAGSLSNVSINGRSTAIVASMLAIATALITKKLDIAQPQKHCTINV
ncbi:hypothetical protein CP500_014485 [Tychonema bourrellyi FEM_GT703]|uniref:Uncharacterized protein n=1 Tax=Tychonema bourrellyi FEM_GT703 TaxID=2040638 RepID=A0A2G4EYY9_9CYAN|nr:hypothetical protein CP500_014485 [Tychonema bourrellyi FEM_GT703]